MKRLDLGVTHNEDEINSVRVCETDDSITFVHLRPKTWNHNMERFEYGVFGCASIVIKQIKKMEYYFWILNCGEDMFDMQTAEATLLDMTKRYSPYGFFKCKTESHDVLGSVRTAIFRKPECPLKNAVTRISLINTIAEKNKRRTYDQPVNSFGDRLIS